MGGAVQLRQELLRSMSGGMTARELSRALRPEVVGTSLDRRERGVIDDMYFRISYRTDTPPEVHATIAMLRSPNLARELPTFRRFLSPSATHDTRWRDTFARLVDRLATRLEESADGPDRASIAADMIEALSRLATHDAANADTYRTRIIDIVRRQSSATRALLLWDGVPAEHYTRTLAALGRFEELRALALDETAPQDAVEVIGHSTQGLAARELVYRQLRESGVSAALDEYLSLVSGRPELASNTAWVVISMFATAGQLEGDERQRLFQELCARLRPVYENNLDLRRSLLHSFQSGVEGVNELTPAEISQFRAALCQPAALTSDDQRRLAHQCPEEP